MADKPNKTEQGKQDRVAEKAARAKATQGRRDSADAAQSRSEQRKGRNVDEGSAGRVAGFSDREANAGLTLAGNDTTAGRDDFYSNISKPQASWASFDSGEMKAGSEMAFKADVPSGGGGLAGIEIIWADQSINFIEAADLTDAYDDEAYWSLVLTVSSGSFDKTLAYDATADIFTTTGTAPNEVQTKYRLRLITQYTNGDGDTVSSGISAYGQYREVTLCVNGSPRSSLIKVT
jgi:hypothetical protein